MIFSLSFILGLASRNLWIIEIIILRVSLSSMPCSSLILSVVSTFAISAALKVPLICVSRSVLSTRTITVGLFKAGARRSFWAANTINRDLPEPWKCHIRPFLILPSITRCTILFAPSYCWKRGITLIRCFFELVVNKEKLRMISKRRAGLNRSVSSLPISANPSALDIWLSFSSIRQGAQNSNGQRIAP